MLRQESGRVYSGQEWNKIASTEARKRAGVVEPQHKGGTGYVIQLGEGKESLDLS